MNASLKNTAGVRAGPPDAGLATLALAQWPGDVALLGADLRVEWINDRFAQRIGLCPAACVGLDWLALHPTAAIHESGYQRACRGEGIELPPFPARGPDHVGYYATSLQPLRRDGGVAGLLVTERDCTAEEAGLSLEQRRLELIQAMAEGSRDVVTLLDAGGRMLFVSHAAEGVTGLGSAALVGRNLFEFVCPDDIAEVRAKFDSGDVLRAPLRMRRLRFRFRHADGQWRWLESLAVNALHDPLLATIIVHSRDVSDDVALEEAVRRRERRFSTLTEKSEDLIVVLGADGNAVFESASISRIFGFRPRELTARRILRRIHPGHRRRAIGVGRELMAHHGAERRLEFMVRDGADGYRWIEAILVDLIEDPDVNGLLINARDVTARKIAETERDSALEEASVFVWEQDLATRRIRWLRESDALGWLGELAGDHDERDWERRVHPDDVTRVLGAYARLESGASTTVSVEYRLQDASGQWRRVLERGQLAGSHPRTAGRLVRGVCIDITERRRIEDALARSREQFRLALECAQIGFYEWDVLADTLTGLDDWCTAHGVPPEAGRPGHDARWESLTHPDDVGELRRVFADHLRGETEYCEVEYRMRTDDGRWIWVFDRAQITARTADGNPHRVVGVCMEIDRRRRAELALRETENRLAATVWGAGIGMWEMELGGAGARWFNDWCDQEDLHPCEGPDHVDEWDAHIHPADLPRAAALFSDLLEGRHDVYESEYRIRTRGGRWIWIFERSRATERGPDGRPRRIVGICMNIQARKEADEALRKSEFLYRTVAEFTPGYVCEITFDDSGGAWVSWATDGIEQVYGVPLGEIRRRGFMTFLDPEDREDSRQRARRVWRGEPMATEVRILRPDGGKRWLHLTVRPVGELVEGRVRAAVGLAHDITERKLAETALRDSQIRLRSIAENSTDWLLLLDSSQRIQFANRAIEHLSAEQLIGLPLAELSPPHDRARVRAFVSSALAAAEPRPQLEQVLVDGPDGPRTLLVRAQPVRAEDAVVGVVLTVTEITRQRRDERMLRLQARILETMREGVVLVDGRNSIRLTNPAFDEMFGFGHGELEGSPIDQLFRLDEAALLGADRRIRAQRAAESADPFEFECMRRDGTTFAAACVITPLAIDGADHWLAVLNDVTERKVLEREILEVSNREQHRIGNDLHDGLGQELTGVALMLRSLSTRIRRSHPAALPDFDEIVALLNQSIHNARTLARGLSPVSLERGGLVPALRTLAARARETYGLSLTLRTRISHPLRVDESAASHLYRIVQEALSNAMRHGRATRVRIQLSSDDVAIRLSVHDNGRGLPAEEQRNHGLGLRTMRYRAQVVGGDLLVTNHRLGGTIVRCVCPQGARERVSLAHAHARAHARAHAYYVSGARRQAGTVGDAGSSAGETADEPAAD
jgi:PAS domain S-box-containing protein